MAMLCNHSRQTRFALSQYAKECRKDCDDKMKWIAKEFLHNDDRLLPYEAYRVVAESASHFGKDFMEGVRDWLDFHIARYKWLEENTEAGLILTQTDAPCFVRGHHKNSEFGFHDDAVMPCIAKAVAHAYSIFAMVHPSEWNEYGRFYAKEDPEDKKYGVAFCVPQKREKHASSQTYSIYAVDDFDHGRDRLVEALHFMQFGNYRRYSQMFGAYRADIEGYKCADGDFTRFTNPTNP